MSWIFYVIVVLIMIMFLVVIHEFGHFIVGYKSGIKVNEFSIGFGPKIFSKIGKKGIKFSMRWLPVGGYVQFHGEDEESEKNDATAFNNAKPWKRFLTLLAGPFMNILLALVTAVIILSCFGDYSVKISGLKEDYPAAEAGIIEGDTLTAINGKKIDFYSEYYVYKEEITSSSKVNLTVLRDGEEKTFEVSTVKEGEKNVVGISGISFERKHFTFFESLGLCFKWIFFFTLQIFSALFTSVKNLDSSQLSGVVGVVQTVGTVIKAGAFEDVLRIFALLSLNLGIFNLLPLPALDGGKIVFLGIEKLRGKPVSQNVEGMVNLIGMVLLFGLMILLTYQDIARLIAG